MLRALPVAAVALAAAVSVSACGAPSVTPSGVTGPAKEAADVLEDFRNALASRDFGRICTVLLAAEARRRAGGKDCPRMLRRTTARLKEPRLRLDSLELRGNLATAWVTTTAVGQAPVADIMRLVRERGRFRILSLSG